VARILTSALAHPREARYGAIALIPPM